MPGCIERKQQRCGEDDLLPHLAGWPTYRAEFATFKQQIMQSICSVWENDKIKESYVIFKEHRARYPCTVWLQPSLDHELAPPQSSCNLISEQLAKS